MDFPPCFPSSINAHPTISLKGGCPRTQSPNGTQPRESLGHYIVGWKASWKTQNYHWNCTVQLRQTGHRIANTMADTTWLSHLLLVSQFVDIITIAAPWKFTSSLATCSAAGFSYSLYIVKLSLASSTVLPWTKCLTTKSRLPSLWLICYYINPDYCMRET